MGKEINFYERKLRAALKEQNTYSKGMEFSIRQCAGVWLCYEKVLDEIANLDEAFITTISREGNKRYYRHPVLAELSEQAENLRKGLRELRLTPSTAISTDADEVEELINEVESIKDDNR